MVLPRVRPAVIGDHLEFVRENIRNGGIRTSVSAAAWDHEEWPPYSAQFKIELIVFGCARCECLFCILRYDF
jgi:hypothetical protein